MATPPVTRPTTASARAWRLAPVLLGLLVFALVVFRAVLPLDSTLFTTDDNLGNLAYNKSQLPHGFFARWDDNVLLGTPVSVSLSWTPLLQWLVPLQLLKDGLHAIDLLLASCFLAMFLRDRGRSAAAACAACLLAFWVGSTFTLIYAGHIGKFGCTMFAALFLWLAGRAVDRFDWCYAVLAGGAMGGMLMEQPDLGLFFCLALGPFMLYALLARYGRRWSRLLLLVPTVAVAAVIFLRTMSTGLSLYTTDSGAAVAESSSDENWNYCTQWSFPPEETIDFIAPGFMGWRSGEPEGPYWGRMGRSPGWEQTRQGFRNFRLETFYKGSLPLAFALLALVAGLRRKPGEGSDYSVHFWAAVALITYLLALGKFTPLYRLFYLLPGMSAIRGPVKFMQVTQLALGILAAYGFDLALGNLRPVLKQAALRPRLKKLVGSVAGLGVLLAVWGMASAAARPARIQKYQAEGWGEMSATIVQNVTTALGHGAVVTLLAAAVLAVALLTGYLHDERRRRYAAWGVVAAVAVEVLLLARHYVKPMNLEAVAENEVTAYLKTNLQGQRLDVVSQQGFYNLWLTYLFPYHGLQVFNVTQMRMPDDYRRFLEAAGANRIRLWQLCAVGYVMGPAGLWSQIEQDPNLKDHFEIAYAFNVFPASSYSVDVVPGSPDQPGQQCIVRNKLPASRYTLINQWQVAEDDAVLKQLFSPGFRPLNSVYVSADTAGTLPGSQQGAVEGSITLREYRAGRVRLQVSSDRGGILRAADKFDPNWKATVDGKPVPVLRCDYLFLGIKVEPGLHEVSLQYAPPATGLWIQLAGMAVCAGAGIMLLANRKGDRRNGVDP